MKDYTYTIYLAETHFRKLISFYLPGLMYKRYKWRLNFDSHHLFFATLYLIRSYQQTCAINFITQLTTKMLFSLIILPPIFDRFIIGFIFRNSFTEWLSLNACPGFRNKGDTRATTWDANTITYLLIRISTV